MNILVLLLGVGLFVLGLFSLKKSLKLTKNGISTMSKVVKVEQRSGTDEEGYKTNSYVPILEYTTEDNHKFTMTGESSKNNRTYKVGDSIKISYDPTNPQTASVHSFSSLWLTPGLILLVGALLMIGAFFA